MAGAMALAQQGLLEEALFCCHKVLVEKPDDLRALETKAFLLKDLNRAEEAIEAFDQVLAQTTGPLLCRYRQRHDSDGSRKISPNL